MTTAAELALAAVAHMHRPDPEGSGMGYRDDGYGRIDPACWTCGTSDEYAVPWPCRTFEAVTKGIARGRLNEVLAVLGREPIDLDQIDRDVAARA